MTIAPMPIAIATSTLADGHTGAPYLATLSSVGGAGPVTWSITGGALPAGLALGGDGRISGTPTASGSSTFTVQASDTGWSGNTAAQAFTMVVSAREIVLYAADATTIAGTWSPIADASAAGNVRVWNRDAGAAKLAAPLASPANYFDLTFQADAGVAYHLWLRGKADKIPGRTILCSCSSRSRWIARSGLCSASAPRLRRRSASKRRRTPACQAGAGGCVIRLACRARCIFAASGTQTIRIQVREEACHSIKSS